MLHIPRLHLHSPMSVLRASLHAPVHGLPHALQLPLAFALAAAGALSLFGVLVQIGPFTSLATSPVGPAPAQVSNVIIDYLNRWQPALDPLLTLSNGVQVKTSNYYGVEIEGVRYYYRLLNTYSADPLTRGDAKDYLSVAVLDPGTQWEVEVYRLK